MNAPMGLRLAATILYRQNPLMQLSYSAKQYVEIKRDSRRLNTNMLNTPKNTLDIETAQHKQPREVQFALRLRF